ncbi:hypothetical protein BC832DRAFT_255605 [Gaertneriomyces semiglobifer]|nr:hypothetical protein BC832DRAFT_255605 [Gaertneriomyces semiglobifer]
MRPLRISALVAASSRAWPLSRPCLLAKSSRLSCTLYSQQRWHDGATTYRREETGKLDEVQYGMPVHVVTEDLTDLSWRAWLKFLLIGGAGLYAGAEMAVHGSQILSMMGLYTYVPDDDDDEDEGGESLAAALHDRAETNAATQEKELASIFGDYRVNLSYNWTGNDVSFLTLARDKRTSRFWIHV